MGEMLTQHNHSRSCPQVLMHQRWNIRQRAVLRSRKSAVRSMAKAVPPLRGRAARRGARTSHMSHRHPLHTRCSCSLNSQKETLRPLVGPAFWQLRRRERGHFKRSRLSIYMVSYHWSTAHRGPPPSCTSLHS